MTPVEMARAALANETTLDSLPTAERAGARLASHQQMRQALVALLAHHLGYASENRIIGTLVMKLVDETFAATNGELRWASELPPGKAPAFRRALNNLIAHFRKNRP